MASPKTVAILFDMKLRRPACVLLQAVSGADMNAFHRHFGGADNWITHPTPGMKLIVGTEKQWKRVAQGAKAK